MTTIIDYKVLFEVRVLHDYYLYGIDPLEPDHQGQAHVEKSFFEMSPSAQGARLQELLRANRYDIRKDLDFALGTAERQLTDDLHLRVLNTPTGFYVGMEVHAVELNGESRFAPAIKPSPETAITIGIHWVNSSFGAITSVRADRDSERIYFFTNGGEHDGVSLSTPFGELDAAQQYRMGDFALVNGMPSQAIADNRGNSNAWIQTTALGLVHQGDRSLRTTDDWFREWKATLPPGKSIPWGVIQIALRGGNAKFSPLDKDGLLATKRVAAKIRPMHPVFELRFAGRSTYWRYRKMGGFSEGDAISIQKRAGDVLDRQGDDFVTKQPHEFALEMPALLPGERMAQFQIPNAQPGLFRATKGKFYSDVYFNSVPKVN